MKKKKYNSPHIETILLDKEISLQLASLLPTIDSDLENYNSSNRVSPMDDATPYQDDTLLNW